MRVLSRELPLYIGPWLLSEDEDKSFMRHAVVLVGIVNDYKNKGAHWILQNSYGAGWGEKVILHKTQVQIES